MSELHENPAPTVPLVAAAALVVITLLGVAFQKFYVNPNASRVLPEKIVIAERELQFIDHADGAVEVRTMPDNEVLDMIAPGDGGFVRGTLRGLIRERRMSNAEMSPGFLLQHFADGAVVLTDLSTSRQIDLRAFGSLNADDFLRYLPTTTGPSVLAGTAAVTNE